MNWIINSLLDTDFYKFTMGQLVFLKYRNVPIRTAFVCRTKNVWISDFIDIEELRRELDHVRDLRVNNSELHYLRGTNEYQDRMFGEDYLRFLGDLRLPPYHLEKGANGQIVIEVRSSWSEAIYWETFILSIVNELYYRKLMSRLSPFDQELVFAEGKIRIKKKFVALAERPAITFTDFGTRRRFSREWQDYVVGILAKEVPGTQFRGTSNVFLAMKYGILPMGTAAHEMFMIASGIHHGSDEEILASHREVLDDWWRQYGYGLSIALTDTYGTDFFFRDMNAEQAKKWKGFRQDSGDPIQFGEKAIAFYKKHGIDPKEKMIVFSDGLDVQTMIKIHDYFVGRINVTFGWGTNLTNDLGLAPLSLVVKPVEACGNGLVKLSDNLAKAIGKPEDVERFKKIFGYSSTDSQECRY